MADDLKKWLIPELFYDQMKKQQERTNKKTSKIHQIEPVGRVQ